MDLKNGNLITPKGASLIFGSKSNADHTNIEYDGELDQINPYIPYTIVIDEEEDEQLSVPAEQVTYNDSITQLEVSNAQQAIERVNEKINNAHNNLKSYIDGPVVRGTPIASNDSYLRGIIVSTSDPDPALGNIGDIWITYEEETSSEG